MSGPAVAPSIAALSRTERLSTWSQVNPCHASPISGPRGLRPRESLNPRTPQQDAGMRIDPPPSFPWSRGTIRAATAAADPPLDPPAFRVRSQGLCVGPKSAGSATGIRPYSGVLVLPRMTTPAAL